MIGLFYQPLTLWRLESPVRTSDSSGGWTCCQTSGMNPELVAQQCLLLQLEFTSSLLMVIAKAVQGPGYTQLSMCRVFLWVSLIVLFRDCSCNLGLVSIILLPLLIWLQSLIVKCTIFEGKKTISYEELSSMKAKIPHLYHGIIETHQLSLEP